MKRFFKFIFCFMIIAASLFAFCSCGEEPAETKKETLIKYNDYRFTEFENGLIGKKMQFKKILQKDHTLVGAKEGYGYEFDDGFVVELYVFDENSEVYMEGVKTNSIPYISPVKFQGTMCIYVNDYQNEKVDTIFEIFRNIK